MKCSNQQEDFTSSLKWE